MNLTEFLLARIAEDEAVAKGAMGSPDAHRDGHWHIVSLDYEGSWPSAPGGWTGDGVHEGDEPDALGLWARFDPARVLAECEAKREVIRLAVLPEHQQFASPWVDALMALASTYADHPDYREEWRP